MKNYNDLIKLIYTNGGATLQLDQDTNELIPVEYKDGYQVAFMNGSSRLRMDCTKPSEIFKAVKTLKSKVQDAYNGGGALNIGVWLDNGYLYIDLSMNVISLNTAQVIGLSEHQKAIFDWKNKRDVIL